MHLLLNESKFIGSTTQVILITTVRTYYKHLSNPYEVCKLTTRFSRLQPPYTFSLEKVFNRSFTFDRPNYFFMLKPTYDRSKCDARYKKNAHAIGRLAYWLKTPVREACV